MSIWRNKYGYDIESYPNVFTVGIVHIETGTRWLFEVSDRRNDAVAFVAFLHRLRDAGCEMVGFNNEAYDYPVIHFIEAVVSAQGTITAAQIYEKSKAIIESDWKDRSHMIWSNNRVVPQIDLFKVMHFDNFARSTSLKKLEIAMRSSSVEDLPFPPGTILSLEQTDDLIKYMCWDIDQTIKFAKIIEKKIAFRADLSVKYGRDMTNFNDTKIGKEHFIRELENNGVACFTRQNGRREPIQTPRVEGIKVAEKLIPVPFENESLKAVWNFFHGSVIPPSQTKGFFKDIHGHIGDFALDFGSGGIHGSVAKQSFYSGNSHEIIDLDVTSYYPSLAIVNGFYPEHLGERFCQIYTELKSERLSYPKSAPESEMLKLALNGVYGDSNNKYSPFYDPAYTMAITINGQLLLAWLAELVCKHTGAHMIQANTDGITVLCPREDRANLETVARYWQDCTRLDLEAVIYRSMHIRDVNNYVAVYDDAKPQGAIDGALKWEHKPGNIKRKNAYLTNPDWHQDHSSLVIQKAVDAFLSDGTRPVDFIYNHDDPYDFMQHIKVPKSSRLEWGGRQVQNISRYYIALVGEPLIKIMPPLDGETVERPIGVNVGWRTGMCSDVRDFQWDNLNRRWYVQEAEKLVEGLGLMC